MRYIYRQIYSQKEKWGWFGLFCFFFSHLDNKISRVLFHFFRVFIQTVVQPTLALSGQQDERPSSPSAVGESFPARIPHTWLIPHPTATARRSLGLTRSALLLCTLLPLTHRRHPHPPRRRTGTCRAGSGGSGRATSPPSG